MRLEYVAPHTGAWIEIKSQERASRGWIVAPHTGAWIEITRLVGIRLAFKVAPHTGAWIEMLGSWEVPDSVESHPIRVRGLKSWGSLFVRVI